LAIREEDSEADNISSDNLSNRAAINHIVQDLTPESASKANYSSAESQIQMNPKQNFGDNSKSDVE